MSFVRLNLKFYLFVLLPCLLTWPVPVHANGCNSQIFHEQSSAPQDNHYVAEDLLTVGSDKPLGYLPTSTIENAQYGGYQGIKADIKSWSLSRGLVYLEFSPTECYIGSGAVVVYNEEALEKMLKEHSITLMRAGVPIHAQQYVVHILNHTVYEENFPDAYRVIGLTFSDPRFKSSRSKPSLTLTD